MKGIFFWVMISFAALTQVAFAQHDVSSSSETRIGENERVFDHSVEDLKQALSALRADDTAKLPTLRGFVTENLANGKYERPYYQFETELVARGSQETLLRVKARVTAWHTDSATQAQEYRSLTSNGRLETEFLQRVNEYLIKIDSDLTGRIESLQKKLTDLAAKTEQLENRRDELKASNSELETAVQSQSDDLKLRAVAKPGALVYDRPQATSRVLATAERDDLFQVLDSRPGWVQVQYGTGTGWLSDSSTRAVAATSDQAVLNAALKEKTQPFVVTRESVTQFLGDWPALHGKKALFLWAQPVGIAQREAAEKLGYVKQVFADRYRDAIHGDVDYLGLVVIFVGTGSRSGVAAARLDDIAAWVNGRMGDTEFLRRCSLDPPEVFNTVRR